jgi:hypothetical protein
MGVGEVVRGQRSEVRGYRAENVRGPFFIVVLFLVFFLLGEISDKDKEQDKD